MAVIKKQKEFHRCYRVRCMRASFYYMTYFSLLLPFVQFKKLEKYPCRLKYATLLKVKLLHGCFLRTNSAKSHKTSHVTCYFLDFAFKVDVFKILLLVRIVTYDFSNNIYRSLKWLR